MDYNRHDPHDWHHPKPRVNRVCTHCWTHWFGPPDAVNRYTKKEWDEFINAEA